MNGTLYSSRAFNEQTPDPGMKKEIDKMLRDQYKKVRQLLEENRESVMTIAEGLLEKNELDEDEIRDRVAAVEAAKEELKHSMPLPLPVARPRDYSDAEEPAGTLAGLATAEREDEDRDRAFPEESNGRNGHHRAGPADSVVEPAAYRPTPFE
jgi:hypothetical protein